MTIRKDYGPKGCAEQGVRLVLPFLVLALFGGSKIKKKKA